MDVVLANSADLDEIPHYVISSGPSLLAKVPI